MVLLLVYLPLYLGSIIVAGVAGGLMAMWLFGGCR